MKTLLLVEDNADDVYLLKRICKSINHSYEVKSVSDGASAIDYLAGRGAFADRTVNPIPKIIFLDLHMPKKTGFEILRWIREILAFRHLPVIVLSGSMTPSDIENSYLAGATSFLRKKANRVELQADLKSILNYWLEFNVLPGEILLSFTLHENQSLGNCLRQQARN